MSDTWEKPPPFKANDRVLSAQALNSMRDAIPRLITGGHGIDVRKAAGGQVSIGLKPKAGAAPGTSALVTIVAIHNTYLVCSKNNTSIAVAKPWGLRRGVVFPTGSTYVYNSPSERVKTTDGEDDVTETLTPNYEVGEELLVRRLAASRIDDDGGDAIFWIDENTMGRRWFAGAVSGLPDPLVEGYVLQVTAGITWGQGYQELV